MSLQIDLWGKNSLINNLKFPREISKKVFRILTFLYNLINVLAQHSNSAIHISRSKTKEILNHRVKSAVIIGAI